MLLSLMMLVAEPALAGSYRNWTDVMTQYSQQVYSGVGNRFDLSYAGFERFESSRSEQVGMHDVPVLTSSFRSFLTDLCGARGGDPYTIRWLNSRSDDDPWITVSVHCTSEGTLRGYSMSDEVTGELYGCYSKSGGKEHSH